MAILFSFASCNNNSSSSGGSDPFSETKWKNGSTTLNFYSDGTVGGNAIEATGGDLHYKVSHDGDSYTAKIYVEVYGQATDFATFTISNEDASSGKLSITASGVTVTLQRVGGSSNSTSGGSDPFSETKWKNGSTTLNFYSDGTVGGNAIEATGGDLHYKVSHDGNSYTAKIYAEVYGQIMDFATFTISNEKASNGTLSITTGGVTVTFQRVGDSSTSTSGSGSSNSNGGTISDKNQGSSNDDDYSNSSSKGIKGGSYGDQFMNTTWSGEGFSLDFDNYGNVTYGADGFYFNYDYYFESTGGSYIAKAYNNNSLMFTFKFSISKPASGKLYFGNNEYNYETLYKNGTNLDPSYDTGDSYYDYY